MPLDRDTASRWLEAYVRAWETYDPHAIGELFAEDATYAWHPWGAGDQVARGRDAIVKADRQSGAVVTSTFVRRMWSRIVHIDEAMQGVVPRLTEAG